MKEIDSWIAIKFIHTRPALLRILAVIAILIGCGEFSPARATATCNYGPHEYHTIVSGDARNHRFSIRAGMPDGDFRIFLFSEPGHRRIGRLEEVDEVMDTCAGAYEAAWSQDSRHVAVMWRTSHESTDTVFYRIEHHRAYLVRLPDVIDAVARHLKILPVDLPSGNTGFILFRWVTPSRFQLIYDSTGFTNDFKSTRKRGAGFVRTDSAPDAGHKESFASFSAVVTYALLPSDKFRLVSLKPGTFGE